MANVLAVIPARSGSKSVKDKNIRVINGKPLLAYSIEHALSSKYITKVIVSTDSRVYADIALKYGAEVPFLRPAELSKDTSLDIELFEHALMQLKEIQNYEPDIVVQLRPTYPIRNVEDIDNMVKIILENESIDSVRCIVPAKEIAYKMWRLSENGNIVPLLTDIEEGYNMPRQELPPIYYQNACIDVIRATIISQSHSMSGRNIYGYKMAHNYDIDTEDEFARAEQYLRMTMGKQKFVFDIDGVIAELREDLNYGLSTPNNKMIKVINKLYDLGNTIVLFTARGYKSGTDWTKVTESQMKKWGVKYHQLLFGKPDADYYIDDKFLSIDALYEIIK